MVTIQIAPSTKEKLEKLPGFKLPKTLAECADLMYKIRNERYAKQHEVDSLASKEAALADHMIHNLPLSEATGVIGKAAKAEIMEQEAVLVNNWDEIYAYIVKNQKKDPGVWSLLQRRIGDGTVKEMWKRGKKMPGCEKLIVKKISLTKV